MGAGKLYNDREVRAIALVVLAHPEAETGPVFWERLARDGLLAPILVARITAGGDLAKFLNRNGPRVSKMVELILNEGALPLVRVVNVGEGKNLSISEHNYLSSYRDHQDFGKVWWPQLAGGGGFWTL